MPVASGTMSDDIYTPPPRKALSTMHISPEVSFIRYSE